MPLGCARSRVWGSSERHAYGSGRLGTRAAGYLGTGPWQRKQLLRSSRRNVSPVELINGPFVMRHEHLACALVEQMEIGKTSSSPDRVLHHPPEAFDGVQVVATMGR